MAREFIRPELVACPDLLAELVPEKTLILIDPDWTDLRKALKTVQKGTRKNKLHEDDLKTLFDTSGEASFFSAWLHSVKKAPLRYGYDYPSSQAAACRLPSGSTAFVLRRISTPPGQAILPPVYPSKPSDRSFDYLKWRDSVVSVFWTHLTDAELEEIESVTTTETMIRLQPRRATRERVARARRLANERAMRKMLQTLCRGITPIYASELSDRLAHIADDLTIAGQDNIPWRMFKKNWTALVDKYQDDLVPLVENAHLSVEAMRSFVQPRRYTLSLGVWTGMQRIFPVPQLVFHINCEPVLEDLVQQDLACERIVGKITRHNQVLAGSHPLRKWSVGWLRVHLDEANRLVFIDEVQADSLELLRTQTSGPDAECAKRAQKSLARWNLHGAASVHRWGHQIGFRLAMHSKASLRKKSGATQSERKWNTYYKPIIKAFGLKEITVQDYGVTIMVESRPVGKPQSPSMVN